jgi:FkbM family methyltransferase
VIRAMRQRRLTALTASIPSPGGAAVFRAIRWTLPRGHRAYPTRGGRLYLDVSESLMMLMRVLRRYEPDKHRALEHMLRPGMTFVDVGACKGDFTLFAAARVGPSGRVVAVEPEPSNATWLRRSIARSAARHVDVHELALSDASGGGILHRVDVSAGAYFSSGLHSMLTGAPGPRHALEVQTQTLDDLLAGLGIVQVDVIKIDVEGSEAAVLRGAAETLTRQPKPPIVLMDLHPDLGVNPQAVAEILRGQGYETFAMSAPTEPLEVDGHTVELVARKRGPSAGA